MSNFKIARLAYRQAVQKDLAPFAANVFNRVNGVAAYASLQPLADQVFQALTAFTAALAAARNRGTSEVLAKNLAKEELIKRLDALANALDTLANGSAQFIVDAGFSVLDNAAQRNTGTLPTPTILKVRTTGKKGELRVQMDNGNSSAFLAYSLEYSLDKGETWKNGLHHNFRNFVIKGVPLAPEIWLKAQSLGSKGIKSDWSEPAVIGVF